MRVLLYTGKGGVGKTTIALASALAHSGDEKEARSVLDRIAVTDIGSVARRLFWRRFKHPETKERVLDGLRKAGLPE